MDASGSISSASGSSGSVALAPPNAGETCAYLSPSPYTGCRMPRSCQSCLATTGCMIDEVGSCVSTQDELLDPTKDFRLAQRDGLVLPNATANGTAMSAAQAWQFPAGVVKYCAMSDETCATCARANFWRSRSSSPDSRYCLGDDGACVCIDDCERRWFVQQDCSARRDSSSVYAPMPSSTSAATTSMDGTSVVNRVWQAMVGSIVFVLVVLGFVVWTKRKSEIRARLEQEERRRRSQARRERRQTTANQLGVNALNLSGWDAYRRDLIEKETAQLSGGGEATTVTPDDVHQVHNHDDEPDNSPNDGSSEDTRGQSTAYVRMREPAEEHEAARPPTTSSVSVSTPQEPADVASRLSFPSERPTATLAPLTVSQNVQPQR